MSKYTTLSSVLKLARTGTVIFADAEYLHGSLASRTRPSESMWKDVVQIGAVKYVNGSKVDTFSALIRPACMETIATTNTKSLNNNNSSNISKIAVLDEEAWAYFEDLTKLKRDDLATRGRKFSEVWAEFTRFVSKAPGSPDQQSQTTHPIVIMMGDKEVYKWSHALRNESHALRNESHALRNEPHALHNGSPAQDGDSKGGEHDSKGVEEDDGVDALEWIRLKPLLLQEDEDGSAGMRGKDSGELYKLVSVLKEDVCPGLSGHDGLFDACSMAVFCTKYNIQ